MTAEAEWKKFLAKYDPGVARVAIQAVAKCRPNKGRGEAGTIDEWRRKRQENLRQRRKGREDCAVKKDQAEEARQE